MCIGISTLAATLIDFVMVSESVQLDTEVSDSTLDLLDTLTLVVVLLSILRSESVPSGGTREVSIFKELVTLTYPGWTDCHCVLLLQMYC